MSDASRPTSDSLASVSSEELLERYRDDNDQQAFDALVHRYERELYNYLYRYVGSSHLAEEVFQATFLHVHQKRHLYQSGRPVRPWLYSIATHLAIDALRKAGHARAVSLDAAPHNDDVDAGTLLNLLEAHTPTPLGELEERERSQWVHAEVDRLPEHLRQVVILIFFQGLKYHEAADSLGVPVGTVKSRLHAALLKLNTAWRQRVAAEEANA
jgi:RNA polymerase sigma-70 factor (ECF subfamily)